MPVSDRWRIDSADVARRGAICPFTISQYCYCTRISSYLRLDGSASLPGCLIDYCAWKYADDKDGRFILLLRKRRRLRFRDTYFATFNSSPPAYTPISPFMAADAMIVISLTWWWAHYFQHFVFFKVLTFAIWAILDQAAIVVIYYI